MYSTQRCFKDWLKKNWNRTAHLTAFEITLSHDLLMRILLHSRIRKLGVVWWKERCLELNLGPATLFLLFLERHHGIQRLQWYGMRFVIHCCEHSRAMWWITQISEYGGSFCRCLCFSRSCEAKEFHSSTSYTLMMQLLMTSPLNLVVPFQSGSSTLRRASR